MKLLTADELATLRIFPLPGVTLFPHGVLPLHVFEPRYRRLVEDCLEAGAPLAPWGIDLRAPPGAADPALRPVATAGRIRSCARHQDGRFDILVEGIERVRFVRERATETPYRIVEAERFPLDACDESGAAEHVATLKGMMQTLLVDHPRAARLLQITLARCEDPHELSDVLCTVTHDDPGLRQHLLEMSSVPARLDLVVETLGGLLLRSSPSAEGPRGEPDERAH